MGEYYGGTFEQMGMEDLDAMMSINLKSHLLITKKALPELIKNKGCGCFYIQIIMQLSNICKSLRNSEIKICPCLGKRP